MGESLHNIAAVYAEQVDYAKAIEFYQQARTIRTATGDRRDLGRTLNNMGGVYYNIGDFNRAMEFYHQALA
ncbi:tetratricopeptide repeat protein, partial [Microcoleus sp. HI-ES]|nr:tetratricopeptide repeat protein [Microcoleus sp. HI-ES]MCZ0903700.1 tetratricopeptide repeat protein [Microcoleus sp. HI-ES]